MNCVTLSSQNAKTDKSHILTYKLKTPINLTGYVKLSSAFMYYVWKNVTEKIGNNKIKITRGDVITDVVIPDGSYSVKNFNNAIINRYEYLTGYKIGYTLFTANPVYNRVTLKVGTDITIEVNNKVAYMLGITQTLEPDNISYTYSSEEDNLPYVPHIENVNAVHINCNLVYNEYQHESRLLYSFTPSSSYGSLLSLEPRSLWKKTRNAVETEISLWLTNEKGEIIDYEDDWQVTITIAEDKFIRG